MMEHTRCVLNVFIRALVTVGKLYCEDNQKNML